MYIHVIDFGLNVSVYKKRFAQNMCLEKCKVVKRKRACDIILRKDLTENVVFNRMCVSTGHLPGAITNPQMFAFVNTYSNRRYTT